MHNCLNIFVSKLQTKVKVDLGLFTNQVEHIKYATKMVKQAMYKRSVSVLEKISRKDIWLKLEAWTGLVE